MAHPKLGYLPAEAIQRELWLRGDLSYMLFPHGQKWIWEQIRTWHQNNPNNSGPFVVEAHRSAGKSFALLLLAIQWALEKPRQTIRMGGPTYRQTLELTEHNLAKIEQSAPKGLLELRSEHITVRNPRWGTGKFMRSDIYFFGVNRGTVESQRGKRANKLILDEVGFFDDVDYALQDVLTPLFMLQENPLMVLSSTPPRSTGHKWCTSLVPAAIRDKRYYLITADENPDFREEDRKVALVAFNNDENCAAWQREYLCRHVSDPTAMVIPEFTAEAKTEIVREHPKPTWCYQFIGFDSGFKDASAVLFSYIDFEAQKWVIEDEIVVHYMPTSDLARRIKQRAKDLVEYIDGDVARPYPLREHNRWIADATPQQIADFGHDHQIFWSAADKKDAFAQLASFRSAIQDRRVVVSPKCVNLIHQLEGGVWNSTRKDFERSIDSPKADEAVMGHLDAVKAAIYLWHKVKDSMLINPRPGVYTSRENTWLRADTNRAFPATNVTRNQIIITRTNIRG